MNGGFYDLILGQALGVIALICVMVSMQLKKKKPLMILQTASEAFIILQYLVNGAITGSLMAVTSFIRDLIFTKYDKRRAPIWILILLYVVMTGLTVLSWAGPLSILPFIGSVIYTFSLWYGKVKWIKLGNAIGNFPYLIYTLLTGNYALLIMTLLEIISSIIGFVGFSEYKKGKNNKKRK